MGVETALKAASAAAPLVMGAGGKKSTTNTAPWSAAQPALKGILSDAANAYNAGEMRIDPYTGQRVAQPSAETLAGVEGMSTPSAITAPVTGAYIDAMNADPYRDFDQIRDTVMDDVSARLGSTFSGGSIDNGLVREAYARAMAEGLGGLEYDAYNRAQDRNMKMMGLAPTIAGLGRADAQGQVAGGAILDNFAQRNIDAEMAKYYEEENADMLALKEYANLAMGIGGMGGTTVARQPTPISDYGQMYSGIGAFWDALS